MLPVFYRPRLAATAVVASSTMVVAAWSSACSGVDPVSANPAAAAAAAATAATGPVDVFDRHDEHTAVVVQRSFAKLATSVTQGISLIAVIITAVVYCTLLPNRDHTRGLRCYVIILCVSLFVDLMSDVYEYSPECFDYIKLFLLVGANCWQIVMTIGFYRYVRDVDHVNYFNNNSNRNILCHLFCCWVVAIVYTLAAFIIYDGQNMFSYFVTSKSVHNYFTGCFKSNIRHTVIFMIPVISNIFSNVAINIHIRWIRTYYINSNMVQPYFMNRMLIRKQLFVIMLTVFLIDRLLISAIHCEITINAMFGQFLLYLKTLQGVSVCYVLVFNENIVNELRQNKWLVIFQKINIIAGKLVCNMTAIEQSEDAVDDDDQ